MKKYLIFLLLVITLFTTSCKKQEKTFIESSKVSCYEDLNTSSRTLYLNIYTSTNFMDLKLKDHHNILDSDIVFKTITKYIYNDEEVDAIFYQFKIIFASNQFSITHLTFTCKDKEYEVDIIELGVQSLDKNVLWAFLPAAILLLLPEKLRAK
jgi:hypothetical protein